MSRTSFPFLCLAMLLLLLAGACNMPGSEPEGSPTPDVTQAYQTVQARLTEAATLTPPPSPTTKPTDTPAAATPTNTAQAATFVAPTTAPTSAVRLCDQADAGVPIDVTIPDNTQLAPNQTFTKVWRLHNSGSCTWTKNYSFAVFSGEALGSSANVPLPKQVEPGQSVDLTVDLVAPGSAGTYQSNWKLKNEAGTWFGIGPGGGSPFWVIIVVSSGAITVTPATATPVTPVPGTAYPPPSDGNEPLVLVSGNNIMVTNDRLNLDNNQLNSGGEDVGLEPNAQARLQLKTLGNAGMTGFGTAKPSYAQCLATGLGAAAVTMRNIPQGFYICYRTDQGLIGWLRVAGYNDTSGTLNLQINTWAQP